MLFEELGLSTILWVIIGILSLWELIWKGFGLWYSARNRNTAWYIFILIMNTVGILPIIYLLTHREQIRKLKK